MLLGSRLDGVHGGESLGNVTIGSDQVVAVAAAVFAALGVVVDDDADEARA